jgi:RNA polymerase sigma-70 factor, ECF subfamily
MGPRYPPTFRCLPMSRGPLRSSDAGGHSSQATSPSLIERLRAQSPDAWRTLVAIYSPLIYRWCRRLGVASSDAADVSQEVFQSVARQMEQFRRSQPGDSFRGWLYTITRNKAWDHLRRHQGQPAAVGGSAAQLRLADLAEATAANDLSAEYSCPADDDKRLLVVQLLMHLRGEFGQPAMTAFWRMVVDGHSAADIAQDLDLSPKAVRQAKYRVLQRLRQELSELE